MNNRKKDISDEILITGKYRNYTFNIGKLNKELKEEGYIVIEEKFYLELINKIELLEQILNIQKAQIIEANKIIKFYADSKVGYEQKDGTYKVENAFGLCNIVYDPIPAKNYIKKYTINKKEKAE